MATGAGAGLRSARWPLTVGSGPAAPRAPPPLERPTASGTIPLASAASLRRNTAPPSSGECVSGSAAATAAAETNATERGAGDTSILCMSLSARVSSCWWPAILVRFARGLAGAARRKDGERRRSARAPPWSRVRFAMSPGRSAGAPLAANSSGCHTGSPAGSRRGPALCEPRPRSLAARRGQLEERVFDGRLKKVRLGAPAPPLESALPPPAALGELRLCPGATATAAPIWTARGAAWPWPPSFRCSSILNLPAWRTRRASGLEAAATRSPRLPGAPQACPQTRRRARLACQWRRRPRLLLAAAAQGCGEGAVLAQRLRGYSPNRSAAGEPLAAAVLHDVACRVTGLEVGPRGTPRGR
jgi:hypothetical protein